MFVDESNLMLKCSYNTNATKYNDMITWLLSIHIITTGMVHFLLVNKTNIVMCMDQSTCSA